MKRISALLATTALIAASHSSVFAGDIKGYAGTGLGYSSLDTPENSVFLIGSSSGSTTITQTDSKSETGGLGGTLFAGIQLNQNFAIEADYVKYAESEYSSTQAQYDSGTLTGSNTATLDYKTQSYGLFLKGVYPMSKRFSLYAKLGADYVDQEVSYVNSAGTPSISIDTSEVAEPKSGTSNYSEIRPAGGLGLSYKINNSLTASAFYEGFLGKGDMESDQDAIGSASLLGLSLSYQFQ
jgi:hypothetical protein